MKDKTTHLVCYQVAAKNAGKKVKITHQLGRRFYGRRFGDVLPALDQEVLM